MNGSFFILIELFLNMLILKGRMKKTILRYISFLALISSPFFSTQTFAAECATGTTPSSGCRVEVSGATYNMTGDISTSSYLGHGILFNDTSSNTVSNKKRLLH